MAEGEGQGGEGGGVIRAIALAALILSPAPAVAQAAAAQQQPGTIQTARAIVARMQMERTLDPMFQQLMPLMVANVQNAMQNATDAPAPLKARLATESGRQQIGAIISEEFTAAFRQRYPDIGDAAAEEYRKAFSEPELLAILGFYNSPVGAKLLTLQPQLQKTLSEQGRAIGREAGIAAVPKIQARLTALDAPSAK